MLEDVFVIIICDILFVSGIIIFNNGEEILRDVMERMDFYF